MAETPRVLLLGDSIRMSYQPHVKLMLESKHEAVVTGPAENCQYSGYTRERLPKWLDELGRPDVVHWNNGLHDVGHNPNRSPMQFPLEAYLDNLKAVLDMLRKTGAKVIWATSTPVHPNRPFRSDAWAWKNEEIDRYNGAALELMREQHIPLNDLHAVVWSEVEACLAEDMLHLNKDGQKVCADAVVEAVRKVME